MRLLRANSTQIPIITLAGLTVVYVIFELLFFIATPNQTDARQIAIENTEMAANAFSNFTARFERDNNRLAFDIEQHLQDERPVEELQQVAAGDYDFWGTSVFFDDSLMFWSGFPKGEYRPELFESGLPFSIAVVKDRNVVYLQGEKSFRVIHQGDTTMVHLATLQRLKQKNTLKIGGNTQVSVTDVLEVDLSYPVYFSFFEPVPEQTLFSSDLLVPGGANSGVIYTLEEDFEDYLKARDKAALVWRFSFLVLILIAGGISIIKTAPIVSSLYSFAVQSVTIMIGWILFHWLIGIFEIQNLFYEPAQTIPIIRLGLNTLFAGLFTFSLVSFLKSDYAPVQLLNRSSSRVFVLLTGFLSGLFLVMLTIGLYEIPQSAQLSLLNLSLIPDLRVGLFYLFSGVLVVSILISIACMILLCVRFCSIQLLDLLLLIAAGFAANTLIWLFTISISAWVLYYSFLAFVLTLTSILWLWKKQKNIRHFSRLRVVLGFCFLGAIFTYIPSITGEINYREVQLRQTARDFAIEEEELIEEITISMLINLEQQLSALQLSSLQSQKSFLESYFENAVESQIIDDWQPFSFSVQLIDNEGDPLAEYTTNLNAPGWTKTFDIFSLEVPFEEERIRRDRLRPVMRDNPLERSSSDYSSYRQGWIPFFASPDDDVPIGWIISSVYKERPQYQKPFRAVISYSDNSEIPTTIHLDEYEDGAPKRSAVLGIPLDIPGYSTLSGQINRQLDESGEINRKSVINGVPVLEHFLKTESGTIIRASSLAVTPANHLYSVVRFFFTLLIASVLLSVLLSGQNSYRIIGHNRRFKDRLIDRFILASLACLLALVGGATYTISQQNSEAVRDDLSNRISNLGGALAGTDSLNTRAVLFETSALLDADAILYSGLSEVASTAPQIFTQNILPSRLPWDVFNSFVNEGSEEEIKSYSFGDLQLLLAYKPITQNGQMTSFVAIPTFLQAPKFNEQLLSTTSLLIALFVVIFGLFIGAAALIANQLTSPLEELNEGIKTISSGNLDTNLPVRSEDEIGALTNAYNIMVFRLKELQQNLVEAEREAAWKEMAQQVAHEIKNPLTPMKLNLQHLERQIKNPEVPADELKEQISRINQNLIEQIESLSRIASDFSKFARPINQEFKKVDIRELLEQVSDLYSHEEGIELTLELPQNDKLRTMGVKEELRRVFINLVKNAIEAMPQGGRVQITAETEAQLIQVSVRDTGEGISELNHNLVFVPNFSTKTSGTGLGLAITKKIVEEHSGTISFDSVKGKGTVFTVSLPQKDH